MSTTFTFRAAVLPTNFTGGPQEFFDAIVERLEIVGDEPSFVEGDVMPSSNQGPWLKGGKQWWVWDEETSTYIPLDVSASTNIKEIVVSDTQPPDPGADDPKVWIKTSGITVLGVFYWFGLPTGWVTVAAELQPNSITTEMLQDDSVSTPKLRNESVTVAKMANNLPFTKFVKGLARQFLRMDEFGNFAGWHDFITATEEIAPPTAGSTLNTLTIPHSLNALPSIVRVVLVCKVDDNEYIAGDEVDTMFGANVIPGTCGFYKATTTNLTIYLKGHARLISPTGGWATFIPDPAKWKFKAYLGL